MAVRSLLDRWHPALIDVLGSAAISRGKLRELPTPVVGCYQSKIPYSLHHAHSQASFLRRDCANDKMTDKISILAAAQPS